jgi:hypothetical protein
MSIARTQREKKRQLGQFLTPDGVARRLVDSLSFTQNDRILEPSMGDGAFVIPIIEKLLELYDGPVHERLDQVLNKNIFGVELDKKLFQACLAKIKQRWGCFPKKHNFIHGDFFRCDFLAKPNGDGPNALSAFSRLSFTHILGNPPFGGTLDPAIQDALDAEFGFRNGEKIKKETYSFFIVKSLDLLAHGGQLLFICSDTFLTIKTMRGLRKLLMNQGEVDIANLAHFSDETDHPMVVLRFQKSGFSDGIVVDGNRIAQHQIELTGNFSWRITEDLAKYFTGPALGEYVVASSGMTVGKNEHFVREIVGGKIVEPYEFEFFDDPITLKREIARARLEKVSAKKIAAIRHQELTGATRRNIRIVRRKTPLEVRLPDSDYCCYNKGCNDIVYSPPSHAIYWKDDGDAVLTFKKNGRWYLHGVGGQPYFKREGLTWQLIAQSLHTRYLPPGYILDSGAPCAFLREGIDKDELYFILGWTLTPLCTRLLKEVINHTKNIQSKDFERLPYPFWVSEKDKRDVVARVKRMVVAAMQGKRFTREDAELQWVAEQFAFVEHFPTQRRRKHMQATLSLWGDEEYSRTQPASSMQ